MANFGSSFHTLWAAKNNGPNLPPSLLTGTDYQLSLILWLILKLLLLKGSGYTLDPLDSFPFIHVWPKMPSLASIIECTHLQMRRISTMMYDIGTWSSPIYSLVLTVANLKPMCVYCRHFPLISKQMIGRHVQAIRDRKEMGGRDSKRRRRRDPPGA